LLPLWAYGAVLVLATVLGLYVCDVVGKRLGVHDHGCIVWDEFCGMWLTLMVVPQSYFWFVVGFFVFRFFDIVKVWPANWFDRQCPNGVGVMMDDIMAGLWSALVLWGLFQLGTTWISA
jgi:phosphatidylglycerophosphatase A